MSFDQWRRASAAEVTMMDDIPAGSWYACEQPERPVERGASFHPATRLCRGCIIAAEAALIHGIESDAVGLYLDLVGESETEQGVPW